MDTEYTPDRQIKLNSVMVVVFVGFVLVQQILAPHKIWEVLLIVLGGALGLGFFWARGLMRGVRFEREMQNHLAKVGDKMQERFVLRNRSRFPALWVSVSDGSTFPQYHLNSARSLPGRSARRWFKGSVCYTRGLYSLGPTTLETGDPFGLFSVHIHYPQVETVLVIPPIIPLPAIEIASGDRIGEGGSKVMTPNRTVTTAGVREYATGDSIYSVHWLTSARLDDLYVRLFDRVPTSNWWVFADMDASVQLGEGAEATEEYSIILAASIADRGLRTGRAVGTVIQGREKIWLPPKTGSGQRREILYSLATVERGEVPLFAVLADAHRSLGRSSSAIIITPSVDPAWTDAVLRLLQRDISVTVLLLDPVAFGGEQRGDAILAKLAAWGVNHYRITPAIYQLPAVRDYFFRPKPQHGQSPSFTAGDLDWSKL